MCVVVYFFFFKQKTAYEMRISDWSSDVCSSDLFTRNFVMRLADAALEHDQADRHLALQRIGGADHRALGDVRMRRQHFFPRAGRQALTGHVADVVDPCNNPTIAVAVDVARLTCAQVTPVTLETHVDVDLLVV